MKIDHKIEKKFLNWLYDQYRQRFGYGIRNIDKCAFYVTYSHKGLPKEFYEINGNIVTTHVQDYAKELEAKGLVKFEKCNLKFFLTEEGYQSVSKTSWQKTLDYLNKNPGLLSAIAVVISIVSLIVAVVKSGNS
jgi:hypothetical protein